MLPADDPGWASYADAILRLHGTPAVEVDLAQPVAVKARAAFASAGLDGPFGLVTPCNPRGQGASPHTNETLLARFLAELDAAGKRYVRADGLSRERRHVEQGVALAWPRADVVALARKWDQSAIYWWDGAAFWVVGALTHTAPMRLGGA
jgi:hypothetical protein